MTAAPLTASRLLTAPHPATGQLHVERTDIVFHNVAPDRVAIGVTVQNQGEARSRETVAILHAAPLGAFVPWQPLALLPVPALAPGDSYQLETSAVVAAPAPLGPPDRVTPRQVLTALGAEDQGPQARHEDRATRRARSRQQQLAGPFAGLPADLFQLLGRTNPHWAGNLNVFVGGRAIERHMAQALRVYPGQMNMAMFVVGSGRDAYAFHLSGDGADWNATLYNLSDQVPLSLAPGKCEPLEEDRWIEVQRQVMLMLALVPPAGCSKGTVEVHVEQRSTRQEAVVEFSLDPAAAGPGCYVVS